MGFFSTTCPKCNSDKVTKKKLDNKMINNLKGEIKMENTNCEFKCHKCGYTWIDTCGFLDKIGIDF